MDRDMLGLVDAVSAEMRGTGERVASSRIGSRLRELNARKHGAVSLRSRWLEAKAAKTKAEKAKAKEKEDKEKAKEKAKKDKLKKQKTGSALDNRRFKLLAIIRSAADEEAPIDEVVEQVDELESRIEVVEEELGIDEEVEDLDEEEEEEEKEDETYDSDSDEDTLAPEKEGVPSEDFMFEESLKRRAGTEVKVKGGDMIPDLQKQDEYQGTPYGGSDISVAPSEMIPDLKGSGKAKAGMRRRVAAEGSDASKSIADAVKQKEYPGNIVGEEIKTKETEQIPDKVNQDGYQGKGSGAGSEIKDTLSPVDPTLPESTKQREMSKASKEGRRQFMRARQHIRRHADTLEQVVDKATDPAVREQIVDFPSAWDITSVKVGQKMYDKSGYAWIVDTVDLESRQAILRDPYGQKEAFASNIDMLRGFRLAVARRSLRR